MSAEFGAIERLLKSGKHVAQYGKVWAAIHEQTGLGTVMGRQLRFNRSEIDGLRRYARQLGGIDPQFGSLKGGRLAMAGKVANEKLTNDSVFGDLLVLATAGDAEVVVNGHATRTPPGAVLSVKPQALDGASLKGQRLVLVENGAIMPAWNEILLPTPWQNSVILYRGHRENVAEVQRIVADHPAHKLALYYDFDPEGIDLALRWGKGVILIPEDWHQVGQVEITEHQGISQRSVFRQQQARLTRTRGIVAGTMWESVLKVMEQNELAIMQEHLTQRRWPLTQLPSIDTGS